MLLRFLPFSIRLLVRVLRGMMFVLPAGLMASPVFIVGELVIEWFLRILRFIWLMAAHHRFSGVVITRQSGLSRISFGVCG